jgi:hypothetical protein
MYGWTQRRGCMTPALVVMGAGSIIGAIVMAARSEYVPALMLGALGIAFGAGLAGEHWPDRGQRVELGHVTVRGTSLPAVIVPVRATKSRSAVVAQAAMGIVCLALAALPGPLRLDATLLIRVFWVAMAVILVIGVRNGIRRWRRERFYLAFTPPGIVEEGINGSSFVPWEAIESVYRAEMYGQPLIGLNLTSPAEVEFGDGAGVLGRLEAPMTGHQRAYMVVGMPVAIDWLMSLMRRYLDDKESRKRIGSEIPPA